MPASPWVGDSLPLTADTLHLINWISNEEVDQDWTQSCPLGYTTSLWTDLIQPFGPFSTQQPMEYSFLCSKLNASSERGRCFSQEAMGSKEQPLPSRWDIILLQLLGKVRKQQIKQGWRRVSMQLFIATQED